MSPVEWDRSENNRIAAIALRARAKRHSFPSSAPPPIPMVHPAWNQAPTAQFCNVFNPTPTNAPVGSIASSFQPQSSYGSIYVHVHAGPPPPPPSTMRNTESAEASFQNMSNHVWGSNTNNRVPLADIKAPTSDFNIQSAPARRVQCKFNPTIPTNLQFSPMLLLPLMLLPNLLLRSEPECTAVLKEFDDGTTALTGKHAPGCLRRNGKQRPNAPNPDHLHDPADLIWRDCVAHFTEVVGPNFNGLDKSQIRNLVYHSREKTFGSNAIAKVESQYSGPSATAFLRCNTTFTGEKKMQRMMCFALPALLNLLMYPMVHMFVDATFDIVPHPFYQCLIIMVFDARLRIIIPVAWILMTGKTNECYWQAFNWLCSAVDEIAPAYIGVDFERAFFTQVSNHFSEADLIGCLFHFKQALRRKMIKLGIPEEEVKNVMQKGIIDLITVIPVEHLNPKGTAFVAAKIYDYCAELYGKGSDEYKESEKKWDDFWADYFMSFWMQPEFVKVWNVAHLVDKKDKMKLLHRTSNGLERYNRHFNGICPTTHPNLVTFAHALHKEAERVLQRMDDVAKGREVPPEYNEYRFPRNPT
ncbi:hypothetical protein HJC23_002885 [Cyclotella cryptica]|uniref:MULE transposase domain-containing protein n=1 Tax=Cyclotella cryptica TaxID=29204 RepID=A0ABD3NSG9_9STRA